MLFVRLLPAPALAIHNRVLAFQAHFVVVGAVVEVEEVQASFDNKRGVVDKRSLAGHLYGKVQVPGPPPAVPV